MPGSDSGDEGDSCYVYWKTESLFANSDKHSHRPTTATAAAKTPLKPKRDTTAAEMPSPSTSATTLTSGATHAMRTTRMSKRRKPDAVARVDEGTMRTLGVLAARLSGRSSASSIGGSRETTPQDRTPKSGSGKAVAGKGKGVEEPPPRDAKLLPLPARQLPTPPPAAPPRRQPSEPTLVASLTTSKPFSAASSSKSSTSSVKPANTRPTPPPPPKAKPPPPVAAAPDLSDDEFYNAADDASFELALSQHVVTTTSSSSVKPKAAKVTPPPLPHHVPAAPGAPRGRHLVEQPSATRSSPRLPHSGTTTTGTGTRTTVGRGKPMLPAALTNAPPRFARPPPAASRPQAKATPAATRPAAAAPKVVVGRGVGVTSGKVQRELEEKAKREMEELLAGAEDWSDDEF